MGGAREEQLGRMSAHLVELEERLARLERRMEGEGIELRVLPRDEVKRIILNDVKGRPKGVRIYASDIAFHYGIDVELTIECLDELVEEGRLATTD